MAEWIDEALSRDPIPVSDDTDDCVIALELEERLRALLGANQCEPTEIGWRELALKLALRHEPAFRLETPADRTGPSGLGGRPVGWGTFALRSRMKAEMRKGATQKEAAKIVSRRTGIAIGTANNVLARKSPAPDVLRRARFEWKAERAMKLAADKLSQE